MRRVLVAIVLGVSLAGTAAAQPAIVASQGTDAVTRGLVAQYEAALIRERRLADDREQHLIADYEMRMRDLRARVDRGDAAAQAQLGEARTQYAAYVAPIAARDSEARQLVEGYQAQLARDIAQASPEQLAALQRFADGDQQAGFDQYQVESARRSAARQALAQAAAQAARGADAADARQLASLGETIRLQGRKTALEVLALWDRAADLDSGDFPTQIFRARLSRRIGDLARSRRALAQAGASVRTERQRSVYLIDLGLAQTGQGDIGGARASYDEGLAISRRLAAADPTNSTAQGNLVAGLGGMGDAQMSLGDFGRARASYEESLAIARRLAAADPDYAEAENAVGLILLNIGDLLRAQEDRRGAQSRYEEGLAIFRRRAAADPSNAAARRNVVASLLRLGNGQLDLGSDVEVAIASYEEGLAIARRLAADDPTDAGAQRVVSDSLARLGDVEFAVGALSKELDALLPSHSEQDFLIEARAFYEESLAIRRRLAAADPTDVEAQRAVGAALRELGNVRRVGGDPAAARSLYAESVQLTQDLASRFPTNVRFREDAAYARARLALVESR